jgi:hypothetical protein
MSGRDQFEELQAGGWVVIDQWVADQKPESLHLEFKLKEDASRPQLDPKDLEHLAKALSGFANTEGGLYIVGLRTSSGPTRDEPDRLVRAEPIREVHRFAGLLDRQLRNYTTPPIAGLQYEVVEDPKRPSWGVLAVHVPPSDGGPHRASQATTKVNDRYFVRIATVTGVMPHDLLADRFGRRPQPKLQLVATLVQREGLPRVNLVLKNLGRGTGRNPAVWIESQDERLLGWNAAPRNNWFNLGSSFVGQLMLGSTAEAFAFPGLMMPVAQLTPPATSLDLQGAKVHGVLYAVDAMPVEFSGELRPNEGVTMPSVDDG